MAHGFERSTPSADYLDLLRTSRTDLSALLRTGESPDVRALSGWEWRGTNLPAVSRLLGIRKFIKGFETVDGGVEGYNVSVAGSDLSAPWTERRQRDGRREWARFAVAPVDPGARDNRYPGAILLDYAAVAAPEPGLARRLRDYLVRAQSGSDDLLVGQAFLGVGGARVPVGWFVLERLQRVAMA